MAVYCGKCQRERDLPHVSLRVSDEPCQFCQGFEQEQVRATVGPPGARRRVQRTVTMKNMSYPDKLINSMPGSFEKEAHKEYGGQ